MNEEIQSLSIVDEVVIFNLRSNLPLYKPLYVHIFVHIKSIK